MTALPDENVRFIYRNRPDDQRPIDELHLCESCGGYYGVPHTFSHCQRGETAVWSAAGCACRFCCEATSRPIQGRHGVFLSCTNPDGG